MKMLTGPTANRLQAGLADLQNTQHFHTHLSQPPRQGSENYARFLFFLCAITAQTDNQDSFCYSAFDCTRLSVWNSLNSYIVHSGLLTVLKSRLKTFLFHQTFTPSECAYTVIATVCQRHRSPSTHWCYINQIIIRRRSAAAYSDQTFPWTICRCVGLSSALWKNGGSDGTIGRMGPGIKQVVGFGIGKREDEFVGANLGRAIVTYGDVTA